MYIVLHKHLTHANNTGVRASFLNKSLTETQRLNKIQNYWKFMIVRNPLERHLSVFNNKLSSSLECNSTSLFDQLKRSMWERYHPVKLKEWISNGCKGKLLLDFATYLRWITDTPNHRLNELLLQLFI